MPLNNDKKRKLRELLSKLSPDLKGELLAKNLEEDVKVVSDKLSNIKDFSGSIEEIKSALVNFKESIVAKLDTFPKKDELDAIKLAYIEHLNSVEKKFSTIVSTLELNLVAQESDVVSKNETTNKELKKIKEEFEKWRLETLSKFANLGGGSPNQRIQVNGVIMSKKYADFNLIGATAVDNNLTKQVDITLSGGGGTPGGSDTQVQFNDAGIFGGANIQYLKATEKTGFGGTPSAKVQYVLADDSNPSSVSEWDERHVQWGTGGSMAPGLGMSYSSGDGTINMSFLEPSVAWKNARFGLNKLGIYSGGTILGLYQDNSGNIGIQTDNPQGLLQVGAGFTVPAATGGLSSINYGVSTPYYTNDGFTHTYRIYPYKVDGAVTVYGAYTETTVTDNGMGGDTYTVTVSWDDAGVDGYKILLQDDYFGANFNVSVDVGNVTTWDDDGSLWTGDATVTPVSPYGVNMIVTSDKKVGIGKSPTYELDVIGTTYSSQDFHLGETVSGTHTFTIGENAKVVSDFFSIPLCIMSAVPIATGPYETNLLFMGSADSPNPTGVIFTQVPSVRGGGGLLATKVGVSPNPIFLQASLNDSNNDAATIAVGIAYDPLARLHIRQGNSTYASIILNSGAVQSSPVAGAINFINDDIYLAITTGLVNKKLVLADGTLTSGQVPVASTNGRLIDGGATATELGYLSGATGNLQAQINNKPIIAQNNRATAQTAAKTLTGITVGGSDASYWVSANINVTTSTTYSFTATCAYTDETNTARTLTLNFSSLAGALLTTITNVTGAGPYEGVPVHIRCKAGTTVTIATVGTFTTVTYNFEERIVQLI